MFSRQPDDGLHTGPKHVVAYYILLLIIYNCVLWQYVCIEIYTLQLYIIDLTQRGCHTLSDSTLLGRAWSCLSVLGLINIPYWSLSWTSSMQLTMLHLFVIRSILISYSHPCPGGPDSSVGITTDYGLDGPASNLGGDEIFHPSRPALEPTQPPLQWVLGLSRP